MAWRISEVEVTYDPLNLWASPPAVMAQIALERELFIERGFGQSGGADAAIISVDVTAFEGIQKTRQAHVEFLISVRDRSGNIHTQRFSGKHPATSDDPADLAVAAGVALDRVIGRMASWLHANAAEWTRPPVEVAPAPGSPGVGTAKPGSADSDTSQTVNSAVTPQTPGLIDTLEKADPDRPKGRWAPANPATQQTTIDTTP